jgi:hypothetical protein
MKIISVIASIHDTGFGGYPFKVTVTIELPVLEFNKLCPVTGKSRQTMFGQRKPASRDLGNLVLDVNNAVYAFNPDIPAYSPSIDSKGSKKSLNGIKTMEFVYFFKDTAKARNLGFEFHAGINSEHPKAYQSIKLVSDAELS